jgi:hypothetical protein
MVDKEWLFKRTLLQEGRRHKMSTNKKTTKNAIPDNKVTDHDRSPYEPAIEEIQARAYEVYVERGRIDGFHVEDWLQAEKELKQNHNRPID